MILLNKCPQSIATSSTSVPTIRRKRKPEESEIPIEINEVQMVDDSQYEIRILQTEESDEFQLVQIGLPDSVENTVVEEVHEIIEAVPKKEKKSPKKIVQKVVEKPVSESDTKIQSNDSQAEYYFRVIDESEEPELDENNEKKIFQCAFENCKETFSRRQQCKTHYYNHLAVDSNFSCKYCSKKFKVQSALERHERVHNNSKVSEEM